MTPGDLIVIGQHLDAIAELDASEVELVLSLQGIDARGRLEIEAHVSERRLTAQILTAPEGGSLSGALNDALEASVGQFVLPLVPSDLVSPAVLEVLDAALRRWQSLDLLYGDDEFQDLETGETTRVYRPGWSLELHLQADVIGRVPVLRRSRVRAVGGFAGSRETAGVPELAMHIADAGGRLVHMPEVLVRSHRSPDERQIDTAAVEARGAWMGDPATTESRPARNGGLRLRRAIAPGTRVSVIVPTRGTLDQGRGSTGYLVSRLIESMERTKGIDDELELEYVIVCDEGFPDDARQRLSDVAGERLRFIEHVRGPEGFNFARMVNQGAWAATGDVLIFVNDDVAMLTEGWLHDVVPLAMIKDVGAVGIKLLFEDRTVQHVGITIQPAHGGWPGHQNYRAPRDESGNGGWLSFTREVLAVTGAFLAISRPAFLAVGGFSAAFTINHNDVDLCLKLRALGYRNLVTPLVSAVHDESASREPGATVAEMRELKARWGSALVSDPYRNPRVSWETAQPIED